VECFDATQNTCVIAPVCALKGALHEAQKAFFDVLDRYSLADVTRNAGPLRALLERPVGR
jgi:Rrf2 family nitric oxide-sensitive transcriptional repressor